MLRQLACGAFAVLCLLKTSTASPSSPLLHTNAHTHVLGVTEAIFHKMVHGTHSYKYLELKIEVQCSRGRGSR